MSEIKMSRKRPRGDFKQSYPPYVFSGLSGVPVEDEEEEKGVVPELVRTTENLVKWSFHDAAVLDFVKAVNGQTFRVTREYNWKDLLNKEIKLTVIPSKSYTLESAAEHAVVFFNLSDLVGKCRETVVLKMRYSRLDGKVRYMDAEHLNQIIANCVTLKEHLDRNEKIYKHRISLNKCAIIQNEKLLFWIERKVDVFEKFMKNCAVDQRIVCTNIPLLKQLQYNLYVDLKEEDTICDLQGGVENGVYILTDIEFISTMAHLGWEVLRLLRLYKDGMNNDKQYSKFDISES